MGELTDLHRPLLSGVEILSVRETATTPEPIPAGSLACLATRNGQLVLVTARGRNPRPERIGSGTLTGLATLNGENQKVLVTKQHIVSDGWSATDPLDPVPLEGDEEMYQGRESEALGVTREGEDAHTARVSAASEGQGE